MYEPRIEGQRRGRPPRSNRFLRWQFALRFAALYVLLTIGTQAVLTAPL